MRRNAYAMSCSVPTRDVLATPTGGVTYAIARGVASGLSVPLAGMAMPHYFGTRRLGVRLGVQSLFFALGTCFGAVAVGAAPTIFGRDHFAPMAWLLALPALVLSGLQLTLRRTAAMLD